MESNSNIKYINGDMFESQAQTIVNPINTVGAMGAGLALVFKRKYPDMYRKYRYFCFHGYLVIGKLYLYKTSDKWILNFPTKQDWRKPSRLEYIRLGLAKLVKTYKIKGIKSIAFPKLGVGYGGLDWQTQVKPLMENCLSKLDIPVYIYNYKK